jgi:hypothetical protein
MSVKTKEQSAFKAVHTHINQTSHKFEINVVFQAADGNCFLGQSRKLVLMVN